MTDRTTVDDARDASQWRVAVWGGAATLMILPVLAMRLAAPGERDLGDFIFLAILLGGVGLTYELAARMPDRHAFRLACAIAVAATLLNIWINLAVGIIGSEDNPANLIYFAVIAIAAAGAVVARFRP